MAEIIPFEPDTDNAGVGSGKTKTVIGAISYEGKRVWLFCETTIPQAKRSGIGKSNNPRSEV